MSVVKSLIATSLAFGLVSVLGCSSSGSPDETPPVISNLSHTDNQKVTGSRTISFSVDATDETSLDSVTITHNGASQTVTNSLANYSASVTLEDRTNNVIVVTANDADNTTTQTINLDYPFLALTDGQDASVVLGQADFVSVDANRSVMVTAPSINTLSLPYDVKVINDGIKDNLFIADRENHRVLVFDGIPDESGVDASFIIGQGSTDTAVPGFLNNQLDSPRSITHGDGHLFIGHSNAGRVNHWSPVPNGNVISDFVIGQAGFIEGLTFICVENKISVLVNEIIYIPEKEVSGTVVPGKLIATDVFGSRVLIWNTIPTTSGVAPDVVIGQQNKTTCVANTDSNNVTGSPSARNLSSPKGVWSDGEKLVVVDSQNYRVLIWNTFPTSHFQAADTVLGQPNLVTGDIASGTNDTELVQPDRVYSNGNQIFISDSDRILIWDSWPAIGENGKSANRVIGAVDMNDNGGGSGKNFLSLAGGVSTFNNKLFVADRQNNRVLIFEAP